MSARYGDFPAREIAGDQKNRIQRRIDLSQFVLAAGDNIVNPTEWPEIPVGHKVIRRHLRVRQAAAVGANTATATLAVRIENGATDIVVVAATILDTLNAIAGDIDLFAAVATATTAGNRLVLVLGGAGATSMSAGYIDLDVEYSPA
jgi:hypothetical protein